MIPVTLQIFFFVLPFLFIGGVFMRQQSQKMFDRERLELGQNLLMEAAVLEAGQLEWKKLCAGCADTSYVENRVNSVPEGTPLLYGYFGRDKETCFCILDMGAGHAQEKDWVNRCIQGGKAVGASYDKEGKQYLALYIPVFSDDGSAAGAVKCSLDTGLFLNSSRRMAQRISRQVIICFSVIVFMIMGMLAVFLRPLRQLKFFLKEVGEKGNVMHLYCRGHNEISELLEILSRMSENIHEYISEVKRLQNRYRAFVPKELVALLGKSDIREVRAGDSALSEGTLAVISMGEFSRLQAECSAEELFAQINLGLAQIIPEIEKNRGQILRFFQGGLLVLFPGSGEAAVFCIGRVLQKLQAETRNPYYAAMDYRKIHLELSGDDTRLQFTVHRSDWEDIRALLLLAQQHNLAMVGGKGLERKLNEEHARIFVRSLGRVMRRGSRTGSEPDVLEIIELSAEKKENLVCMMKEMEDVYTRGIDAFYQGHFLEGRECFAQIVRKNHSDRAAQRYFILCDQRLCKEKEGEELCFDWI